ncbi:MAG TPA: AAA family ATPase [Methylophilus sp.]|uniref:AAA family ATPase n=1 Tax=Methylophilus sp. TaxID=29541 RepID=UPI002CAC379E|nr:AAA family ATPase [Methylophilus sp.]HSH86990.1 AAA family ATPase [Methylophilus sp.]
MGFHLTARLAWHDSGWNGHVCNEPKKNTYCIGAHSYPGDMVAKHRDLESEQSCSGQSCANLKKMTPCAYSVNAFGKDTLTAFAEPPDFFNKDAKRKDWVLPPATVCVWPYEEMYREEVRKESGFDAHARKRFVDAFFSKIEEKSSFIFYYANYSNPFSTDEEPRYVLIGVSRIIEVGDDLYYEGCDEKTLDRYGGYVWDRNITSNYPAEGVRLPYHLYKDDSRIEQFAVFPDNPILCKYGSKLMTDDQALGLVEQFHQAVLTLIEMGDKSENWDARRKWLEGIISELWTRRGAFPGMAEVCKYLKLSEAIPFLKAQVLLGQEISAVETIWSLLDGTISALGTIALPKLSLDSARRSWKLLDNEAQKLLRQVLSRIDINAETMGRIIDAPYLKYGLVARTAEIVSNPYILSEQFVGEDTDDRITWGQLDRAALPSPELGVSELVGHDSPERLRALTHECLTRVSGHTFIEQSELIALVNRRLQSVPAWKQVQFKAKYFEVDEDIYRKALFFHSEEEHAYVYLKDHYEAEKKIEQQLKQLIQRPDIQLKIPMTESNWREYLYKEESSLAAKAKKEYEQAIATQIATCQHIFLRGLSVLCGAAGTGKTTVLASIVKAIRKVDGVGASIIALAPTGKAADRTRGVLRDAGIGSSIETATIHSFLAKRGWLNDNLTFKRLGGELEAQSQTIIIDECSMMDLSLFATLFRAVNWTTVKRLILVGDPNQLPPIGIGRVFADIVDYCRVSAPGSISELTANLRQLESAVEGKGIGIISLAALYRQTGLVDEKNEDQDAAAEELLQRVQASGDVDKDLRVLYWQEPEDLSDLLLTRLTVDMAEDAKVDTNKIQFHELWDKAYNWKPEYAQVLSPYRGELYGIEALNLVVQQKKSGELIQRKGSLDGITLFDKVIQIRNRTVSDPIYSYDYKTKRVQQCDVFNGELGFVGPHGYDKDDWKGWNFRLKRLAVAFAGKGDLRVNYGTELGKDAKGRFLPNQRVEENLELGYAISVHKAQGSEFERIYVVIPASKRQLLSQELLYTALTRGKRHCTLLIQGNAGALIDMRRRERCWLSRINSSLLGWHLATSNILDSEGWYEDGKVHESLTGDMVRSKSEVIIANMLHERGIKFFYEKPLFAPDGTMYLPDFTIIWNGEEIYWEHVGKITDGKYLSHWRVKQEWYEKNFPNKLKISYERSSELTTSTQKSPIDVSTQANKIINSLNF